MSIQCQRFHKLTSSKPRTEDRGPRTWHPESTTFISPPIVLYLITLSLTGASWLFLGLIYGTLGYCPLTDWHFSILFKLGKTDLPDSYVKYLTDRITGLDLGASLVDHITLYTFLAALILSIIFNILDWIKSKKATHT